LWNETTTSATFTIEDTTEPSITTAADLVVECDGEGNQVELQNWLDTYGGATATDICSGNVTWTNDFTPLTDDCGATGEVSVTFTATDDCGNTSTSSAVFTIEDTTVPSIDTPAADLVVECDGAGNITQLQDWLNSNGGALSLCYLD